MFWNNWGVEQWASLAALIGLPLALIPLANSLFSKQTVFRREILNALPAPNTIPSLEDSGLEEIAYLRQYGTGIIDLLGDLSGSERQTTSYKKALISLVKQHRVQIASVKIELEGGRIVVVPLLFKGGITPSLREEPEEAIKFIRMAIQ